MSYLSHPSAKPWEAVYASIDIRKEKRNRWVWRAKGPWDSTGLLLPLSTSPTNIFDHLKVHLEIVLLFFKREHGEWRENLLPWLSMSALHHLHSIPVLAVHPLPAPTPALYIAEVNKDRPAGLLSGHVWYIHWLKGGSDLAFWASAWQQGSELQCCQTGQSACITV